VATGLDRWYAANPMPRVTVAQLADHIDHIRQVAGIDHVGLGSDYDGLSSLPEGLEDVSGFPTLLVELARRGYSRDDLARVAGLNVLQVMADAERVAASLTRSSCPSSGSSATPAPTPTSSPSR
jgi:membrane dipeptidase